MLQWFLELLYFNVSFSAPLNQHNLKINKSKNPKNPKTNLFRVRSLLTPLRTWQLNNQEATDRLNFHTGEGQVVLRHLSSRWYLIESISWGASSSSCKCMIYAEKIYLRFTMWRFSFHHKREKMKKKNFSSACYLRRDRFIETVGIVGSITIVLFLLKYILAVQFKYINYYCNVVVIVTIHI